MHDDDARTGDRIQCANAIPVTFTLADHENNSITGYCICTDLSPAGGHFFTDIEFTEQQSLMLTIAFDDGPSEQVPVKVIRADSSLNDDERFCADVSFERLPNYYQQLVDISRRSSQSIAA